MAITVKEIIKNLAKRAVVAAEAEFGDGKGELKKQMAINYIVEHLPFSTIGNRIMTVILKYFIDDVIESAVNWLHSMQEEEQGD